MPGEDLWKNTAVLTASALLMRLLGMVWQAWLARRLGAAAMGLWQLMGSVGFLFATAAVAGIRYTSTRLLAQELGSGRPGSVAAVIRRGELYALFFGFAAMAALYAGAGIVARRWIGDERTVLPLRLLALSLPSEGITGLLSGYFIAVGRVWKTSAEQLVRQLLRMGFTAAVLGTAAAGDEISLCAAAAFAGSAAEIAGTLLLLGIYALDRRRFALSGPAGPRLTARMLGTAFPLALSALARSALGTCRQMLVPWGLRSSGLSRTSALAGVGVINGMALPLLTFPACLPGAVAELLVPALTRAQAAGQTAALRRQVERMLRYTLLFSTLASVVFYAGAEILGALVYRSRETAVFLRILAPMVPLIYTDIITDGCLKGLGEMLRSMTYNAAEGLLGLALVWALLPRWALTGYIVTLYACEIFNFSLSLGRLKKVTGCRIFLPQPERDRI